jgi:erythromycin esterase-like protein
VHFTLDPAAPLDDLEPLAGLIGDARVVAIGESAHFVREYHLLRHRLIRFLTERLGFTTVAFESGFSEGLAVREWMREGAGDPPGDGMTYRFARCAEMRDLLGYLKERGLDYWGLDLPGDLASMGPALDHLDQLPGIDRQTLSAVRRHVAKFASAYTIPAFSAYREMALIDRDALTLALAELTARFDATPRRADAERHAVARHELRLMTLLGSCCRRPRTASRRPSRAGAQRSRLCRPVQSGSGCSTRGPSSRTPSIRSPVSRSARPPSRRSGRAAADHVKRAAIQSATRVVLWKTAPSCVAPSSSMYSTGWL